MTPSKDKKKRKIYIGYLLRSKHNGKIRELQQGKEKFYEFPWLWKGKFLSYMKKVRITVEEI